MTFTKEKLDKWEIELSRVFAKDSVWETEVVGIIERAIEEAYQEGINEGMKYIKAVNEKEVGEEAIKEYKKELITWIENSEWDGEDINCVLEHLKF